MNKEQYLQDLREFNEARDKFESKWRPFFLPALFKYVIYDCGKSRLADFEENGIAVADWKFNEHEIEFDHYSTGTMYVNLDYLFLAPEKVSSALRERDEKRYEESKKMREDMEYETFLSLKEKFKDRV